MEKPVYGIDCKVISFWKNMFLLLKYRLRLFNGTTKVIICLTYSYLACNQLVFCSLVLFISTGNPIFASSIRPHFVP